MEDLGFKKKKKKEIQHCNYRIYIYTETSRGRTRTHKQTKNIKHQQQHKKGIIVKPNVVLSVSVFSMMNIAGGRRKLEMNRPSIRKNSKIVNT